VLRIVHHLRAWWRRRRDLLADDGYPFPAGLAVTASLRADYRVADSTIEGYELYIGQDAAPDFTAAPDETFTALPHETGALAVDHAYQLATRYRNRYNLVSQNITSWRVTTDGAGDAEAVPPTGPASTIVDPAAAGAVRIRAEYFPDVDGTTLAATIWAIWITSDGTDPDPDVDAVTATETMTTETGYARLDYTSGTYADGLTIKVVVRTRRVDAGPANVDSTNTVITSTTSDTDGPSTPDPDIFHGETAEEAQ
jgi:hypothetical protein